MKKKKAKRRRPVLIFLCTVIMCLCSCTRHAERDIPTEGIWYCPELSIVIDFAAVQRMETDSCAVRVTETDRREPVLVSIDYGHRMYIRPTNPEQSDYACGAFELVNDVFRLHDEDKVYLFVRKDAVSIEDFLAKPDAASNETSEVSVYESAAAS